MNKENNKKKNRQGDKKNNDNTKLVFHNRHNRLCDNRLKHSSMFQQYLKYRTGTPQYFPLSYVKQTRS
jgi:hypothetical protein